MKLIELDEEWNIILNPELFLIDCFEQLRLDRKKDKKLLLKEIGFIYFFYNLKSVFQFETNKAARKKNVKSYVKLDDQWEVDDLLQECIDTYLFLSQTVASKLLNNAYMSVDKINAQLDEIDLNERDKMGKPIWNLKQFADTTKIIPQLFETMEQAEKAYLKGQAENDTLRGDKLKTLYEDSLDFGEPGKEHEE